MSLDITSDVKPQSRFRIKNSNLIRELSRRVHFNAAELDAIVIVYFKLLGELSPTAQYISRQQFRSVFYHCFDMPEDFLIERIMFALDNGITPYVTLETWIKTMSLFLRSNLEEQIVFCFTVYDILADGVIRRDQLIALMRKSMFKKHAEDVAEAVMDFVDMIIRKMDLDIDGAISFKEYREAVLQQPALLQCFGQCLPDRASIHTYLSTFTHKIGKF